MTTSPLRLENVHPGLVWRCGLLHLPSGAILRVDNAEDMDALELALDAAGELFRQRDEAITERELARSEGYLANERAEVYLRDLNAHRAALAAAQSRSAAEQDVIAKAREVAGIVSVDGQTAGEALEAMPRTQAALLAAVEALDQVTPSTGDDEGGTQPC